MNPTEAYKAYSDAEMQAAKEYEKYWLDKFAAAGVQFNTTPLKWYSPQATYDDYELVLYTGPARYEGAKIQVQKVAMPNTISFYHTVKIKSDSGFAKLMLKLNRRMF